ncbi:MAG: helix-turn-helix domain-containing protein [Candidatus Humimicrobiaceae bacterium]
MVNPEDTLQEGDVLNAIEVRRILKISEPTLRKILSQKREPGKIFGKKVGRSWKILREDVYRYLKEANNKNKKKDK